MSKNLVWVPSVDSETGSYVLYSDASPSREAAELLLANRMDMMSSWQDKRLVKLIQVPEDRVLAHKVIVSQAGGIFNHHEIYQIDRRIDAASADEKGFIIRELVALAEANEVFNSLKADYYYRLICSRLEYCPRTNQELMPSYVSAITFYQYMNAWHLLFKKETSKLDFSDPIVRNFINAEFKPKIEVSYGYQSTL